MHEWNPEIEIIGGEVHRNYLELAYSCAWANSDDTITKTGAVIVNPTLNEIIACSANHFPDGLEPTTEQTNDRKWKYEHIIHAEPGSIFAAARAGKITDGATMYMPWVPCTPCAISIIDAGIKNLIGHKSMIMRTPERWWASIDYALGLLEKCGVRKFMYNGPIGNVKSCFDGIEWDP